MSTTKITYELPKVLPHGWKKEVASLLCIHRHTLANALERGEINPNDDLYKRIIKVAKVKYGKPIKTINI